MPSKPPILGQSLFRTCEQATSAEDFYRNRPGCLPTFASWTRKQSQRLEGAEGAMSWPHQSTKGLSTRNALQAPVPWSVSKMLRCFWLQSACGSLPGPVLGWTELYAHLQCPFA